MFKSIKKSFDNLVKKTSPVDDEFYAKVVDELEVGYRDKSAMGKAISKAKGDFKMAESLYIKIRASTLQKKRDESIKQQEYLKHLEDEKEEKYRQQLKLKYENNYYSELFKNELEKNGYEIMTNYRYVKANDRYYETIIIYETREFMVIDPQTGSIVMAFELPSS